MLTQEKEQIKTLISDISHQIKTPVAAANTFAQLLGDTGLSDEERSEYIATLQMSLEKLTFLTNSLIALTIISANPCIVFAECGMKGSFMERFPLDKDDHQIEGRPIERPSCCF